MSKALVISLSEAELVDLYHLITDRDEAGALGFLDRHLKKKVSQALEGG